MASDSPKTPVVCFLCLETIQRNEKAKELDLDLLFDKFLVFTENHLDIPKKQWVLVDGVKLKNAFCLECSSFVSVLCSLYENLCDIQVKLADKMGQLTSLLESSKERTTKRKEQSLMETLERQLGVSGGGGKKVQQMRDLLVDKCKLHSTKPSTKKSQTSIPSGGCDDGDDNSESYDGDSIDVKIENSSIDGSDADDNDLQNYSNDSIMGNPNKIEEQNQDHSASSEDDKSTDDDDDNDADFNLDKRKSTKTSPADKGPFWCDLCEKEFSSKCSVQAHKKNLHGTTPPKREKPFSCNLCPNKFGTRNSLISHISFRHRGHSILDKRFKCDICSRGYTTPNGVVIHKQRMHKVESATIDEEQKTHHIYNVRKKDKQTGESMKRLDGTIKNDTSDSNDDLQNDSMDSLNQDPRDVDEKDQDYSAPLSSPSSSDHNDNSFCEDDNKGDPDFRLEKITPGTTKKSREKRYSCDLCDKTFSNQYSIPTHKKYIHGIIPSKHEKLEKPFSCKYCPTKLATRVSLVSHISSKHRGHSVLNKSFKCDMCGRGSTTKYGVVLHKKKMHGIETKTKPTYDPKKIPCDFCPKSFKESTSWSRHINAKHKSYKKEEVQEGNTSSLPYTCTECSMSFETQRQRVHHTYTVHKKDKKTGGFMKRVEGAMKTDTSDQTHQLCVVCSKEFKSWKLLHYHLKHKHEKVAVNKKTLMCYFCNCLFCYEQSVWAHLRTCISHNYTKIEFPCDHADHLGYSQWIFKDPSQLESHFKEKHEDCKVLKCCDCCWPFLDKNMLELHRLVHLPKVKCKYQCPGCSNTFLNTDTLLHHYNSIHGVALKLYRCKKCNMGFDSKAAIPLHSSWCFRARSENEDDKRQTLEFLCSECPKSYETAYQLKNHVRMIHVTAQCPDCGVVLPKSKIGNHKTMKHGKEKFLCTLCGKAYKKRCQLQMHMSSHGQYKWICKYCGSGSRSSSHLRRHTGRMHKDKLAEDAAAKSANN